MDNLSIYFAMLTSIVMLSFLVGAFILSRRQNKNYERNARIVVFHCMKCDSVYTAPSGTEAEVCPKCGYKNSRLKF